MQSLCTEVDSQVHHSSNKHPCSQDKRLGEINVPNAGAIHNPTNAKQAEELTKISGKARLRSIMATLWCDSEEVRKREFDKITNVWMPELKFVCYGAIERTEENKKPHCHVLIMFNGQKQWATIIKTMDVHLYHIERVHNINSSYSYCRKENPNDLLEFGKPPSQGARNDLKKLVDECEASIEKIMETDLNTYARYRNGLLDYCQYVNRSKQVLTRINGRMEDKKCVEADEKFKGAEVYWFYGPTGTGKSRTVKEMLRDYITEGKCTPATISIVDEITLSSGFFNGPIAEKSDVLWIDDFRGSDMKFNTLLKLFDGRTINVKGKQIFVNAKYIFITSAMSPYECYPNLAENDRIDQLIRRINHLQYFHEGYNYWEI